NRRLHVAVPGSSSAPFPMAQKIPVAVVGASGYSGRELLRLLLQHPHADITAVTSRQFAGKRITSEFPRFRANPAAEKLTFTAPAAATIVKSGAQFAFLALPHGVAHEYASPLLEAGLRVIDLSADFRL